MKIEIPHVFSQGVSLQPASTTLLATNGARVDAIICANDAGPFYVKRGPGASASNYTFMLTFVGQMISIENYNGVISIFPAPTAGQVNVDEGTSIVP